MNRMRFVIGTAVCAVLISGIALQYMAFAAVPDIQDGINAATADAASRGATVEIAYLDRATGHYAANDRGRVNEETASVAKVLIADDLLFRESKGEFQLSPADRGALTVMLRSSDDGAAQNFWDRFGGSRITAETIARYRMGDAQPAGQWYDTRVSPADMVGYYNQLVGGTGGLPDSDRDFILAQLRASTAFGTDGYNQRFGLPGGLNDPVQGVKQGWMIAEDNDWVHNSTDIDGPDGRYIVVVFCQEPATLGDGHARDTIDRVAHIMFPDRTTRMAEPLPPRAAPDADGSTAGVPGPVQLLIGSVQQMLGSAITVLNPGGN